MSAAVTSPFVNLWIAAMVIGRGTPTPLVHFATLTAWTPSRRAKSAWVMRRAVSQSVNNMGGLAIIARFVSSEIRAGATQQLGARVRKYCRPQGKVDV